MNVCLIVVLLALNKFSVLCFSAETLPKGRPMKFISLKWLLIGDDIKRKAFNLAAHAFISCFNICNFKSTFKILNTLYCWSNNQSLSDEIGRYWKNVSAQIKVRYFWLPCLSLVNIFYVKDIFVGINYFPILIIFLSCAVCANIVSVWTIFCMSDFIWNMLFFFCLFS